MTLLDAPQSPPIREAVRALKPPQHFCLPGDYRQNAASPSEAEDAAYWSPERIKTSERYQFHVYRWAGRLIQRHGITSAVDVGCGVATKLATLIHPICSDVEGIDSKWGVKRARELKRPGRFTVMDLEAPHVAPERRFGMVICADVIEHLNDPDPLIGLLRRLAAPGGLLVLSTPERDRLRGRSCRSADKPEHVREWSRTEFTEYLSSRGLCIDASTLFPCDESSMRRNVFGESRFRLGLAPRSGLVCHAVLCRAEANP